MIWALSGSVLRLVLWLFGLFARSGIELAFVFLISFISGIISGILGVGLGGLLVQQFSDGGLHTTVLWRVTARKHSNVNLGCPLLSLTFRSSPMQGHSNRVIS